MLKKIIVSYLLFISGFCFTQEKELSSINKLIESKKYDESIAQLIKLEGNYPNSTLVKFKLAQVYFWSSKYEVAFQSVKSLDQNNEDEEVLKLKILIQQNRKVSDEVVALCNIGIEKLSDKNFYYQQQVLAYINNNELENASNVLSKIQITDTNEEVVKYLRNEIANKKKNFVMLGYLQTNTLNGEFPIWYLTSLEYGHKFEKHTLVGRVNYSFLASIDAVQFEMDWYPKISKNNYLYTNVAISNSELFPNYKIAYELFHEKNKISISVGGKNLFFDERNINMITAHFGYLIQSYKIAYRGYFIKQDNSDSYFAHLLSFQRKLDEKDSYVQLEFIYGSAPYFYFTTDNFTTVVDYRIGLLARLKLNSSFILQPNFQYQIEEYAPNNFRNKLNLQANLTYIF